MKRPPAIRGLRHVALNVGDLAASEAFYVDLLGFEVEWRPDDDNVYLTSGCDNLALHTSGRVAANGALDHIGIILDTPEAVDQWHEFLSRYQVRVDKPPRTHRDGARSFYCRDPDGNSVQLIYHPPLAGKG